jgi:hypothetical protein
MKTLGCLFMLIASFGVQANEGSSAAERDVVDTYAEAKRLEKEIVEMYREIRAAELSVVQRQTYDRSLESTLIPLSDRAEVNAELLRMAAADAAALERYQKELGIVVKETDAIVANARSLLEQFLEEPSASSASRPEEERPETVEEERPETAEEKAAREAREQTERAEQEQREQMSREKRERREQARKEKQERLEQEIEEELAQTEKHLTEALNEIREARNEVKEEKEKVEKELQEEEKADEQQARRDQLKKLEELEKQVDEAEQAVEEVVKEVGELKEPSEDQKAKAEAALEKLREAMAKVIKADQTAAETAEAESGEASEKEASETTASKTKQHTENAVASMKNAGESLSSASNKLSELESLGESDGEGGGSNSDGDGEGEGLSEALAIERQQALGRLAKASSGRWLDLTDQMRGFNLDANPVPPPQAELPELWASREELDAMPSARKILSGSTQGNQWFFVGDWYVLSRYDNTGRANIQKVYPPESILDLNAHYLSEDGKRLQWEYESYAPPVMTPYGWEEWKIYYFYTELYFAEETEAWLAIGSDDRSDLWINDLPVWHSSNQHKGWYPGEGFRKVVFREGHNKVLLRLENGHGGAGVSVFLNVENRAERGPPGP